MKYILVLFLLLNSTFAFAKSYNILVIFSYVPSSWNVNGALGVQKSFLSEDIDVNITEYVYDNISVRKTNDQLKELAKITSMLKEKKIDGIVVFDDEAADDLIPSLGKLNIPISVTGINKEKSEISWIEPNSKLSIVYERYPYLKSLKLLKEMNKNIKSIKILTTENESSKRITNQLKKTLAKHDNSYAGIKLDQIIISKRWKVWKKHIKSTDGKTEALWILVPWNVYHNNKEVDLRDMGKFYQKNSKVPAIGIVDINTQMGFLASFYVHSEDLGFQAGSNLIKHLQGSLENRLIEDTVKKTRFVLNKERMTALNLEVPLNVLDMATIQNRIEHKVKR